METPEASSPPSAAPAPELSPEVPKLKRDGQELIEQAKALAGKLTACVFAPGTLVQHEEFQVAGELLKAIATFKKGVSATFDPICDATNKAHKAATGARADLLKAPDDADKILRPAVTSYLKKEGEARAKAEAEAQKLAQAQAEEVALAEAEGLHNSGFVAEAEAVISVPVQAAPVRFAAPKVSGMGTSKVWTYEILDVDKLDRKYMVPDKAKLDKLVAVIQLDAQPTVGEGAIRVYQEDRLNVRSGK